MADVKEIVDELAKVRLAPLLLPILKLIDPLMGAVPQGAMKGMMAQSGTQEGLVKTVEGLAPVLPALVRFAGNVARSRLVTGSLSLTATLLTPVVKLTAPLTARLVVPSIGPSLKLVNAMAPALPAIIKVSDGIFRVEVAIERGFGGRGR